MFIETARRDIYKLRRSGMTASSTNKRSQAHAAPTELGPNFRLQRTINMALLAELSALRRRKRVDLINGIPQSRLPRNARTVHCVPSGRFLCQGVRLCHSIGDRFLEVLA